MARRANQTAIVVTTITAALAACGPMGGVERHVTAAQLDSLPHLTVTDGRVLCVALGNDPCPLHAAIANWLDRDHYALWEPGRLVRVYGGSDTTPRTIGTLGDGADQYSAALGVGPDGSGVVLIDRNSNSLKRFDKDGHPKSQSPLPVANDESARGFIGAVPVIQRTRPRVDSSAVLEVQLLNSPSDNAGRVALDAPITWFFLREGRPTKPTPFFPTNPTYTVDVNRTILWSPGDQFKIERRTAHGAVLWTLTGDQSGAAITPADIATERHEMETHADTSQLHPADIDSMIAHTGKRFAAITGISTDPAGPIVVAGSVTPTRDSVDYFILASDGTPTSRFRLDVKTQLLLFTADSLLVHQPTDGEPWQNRWLLLKRKGKTQ